jgi:hypothetical protein
MPVLLVLSMSLSNDNGSKTAKGTFFLISSATFNGSLSASFVKNYMADARHTYHLILTLSADAPPKRHRKKALM